jgi:ABC-type polysaccharide/polyol phosphate export permease
MFEKAIKDLIAGALLYRVWLYQAYHELTVKYKRTILGSLWVSGSMVATSLAVSIVFGGLFGQSLEKMLPYCMGGLLAANLCFFAVTDSGETLMSTSGIIRNHAYPFTYYIFEHMCRLFFLFLHNLAVYIVLMIILGTLKIPHWSILLGLPLVFIYMFTWGMLTAMLSARFRDMRYLLPYIGQLLFFLTPLYWFSKDLSGWRTLIVDINPFFALVQLIRAPLLGEAPTMHNWMMAGGVCATGIVLWLIFFSAYRRKIPFWV